MQESNKTPEYGRTLWSLFSQQLSDIERAESVSTIDRPQMGHDGVALPKSLQAIFDAAAASSRQLRIRQQAMELFQQKLLSGSIRIVGRRTLPNLGTTPEWVPSEFWNGASISPEQNCAANGQAAYDHLSAPRIRRSRRRARVRVLSQPGGTHPPRPSAQSLESVLLKSTPDEVAPPKMPDRVETDDGGRPNMSERIKEMTRKLWKADENFRNLPDRAAQARVVKAIELGEHSRNADDMAGCKLSSARRWVGEEIKKLEAASAETA